MKTRVTVSLDREVLQRAKSRAARIGTSLSAMLRELIEREVGSIIKTESQRETFSARWAGKMKVSMADDARTGRLKKKHRL